MVINDILDVKKVVEEKLYKLYSISSSDIEITNISKIGATWSVSVEAKKDAGYSGKVHYYFYLSIDSEGNVISFSKR
jgi:hypothetical protein